MTRDDETDQAAASLRARLAARDPQATAPVTPMTHEHLERAMSETTRRTPLLVAGVAAALALSGGGAWLALAGDDAPDVQAGPATSLVLKDPGNTVSASCMMLTKELIASQEVAFAGTVTSVEDGSATLAPTKWFKGTPVDQVKVSNGGTPTSVSLLLEKGKSYLIATSGDTLNSCTGSGEETPELRRLFDEAFA